MNRIMSRTVAIGLVGVEDCGERRASLEHACLRNVIGGWAWVRGYHDGELETVVRERDVKHRGGIRRSVEEHGLVRVGCCGNLGQAH